MLDTLHRRLAAVGIRTPTQRDAAGALLVAVANVTVFLSTQAILTDGLLGPELWDVLGTEASVELSVVNQLVACLLIAAQAGALTIRRRYPLLCVALVGLGQVLLAFPLAEFVQYQGITPILAAYAAGAYAGRGRGRAIVLTLTVAAAQVPLTFVLGGPRPAHAVETMLLGDVLSPLVSALVGVLVGIYVAMRREHLQLLRNQVDQAQREQDSLATQAVLTERSRMARELHDVAAHHLSGIVIQATAAERLVDHDPERAKESLRWIRQEGRETLDNLRLVVGILRTDQGPEDPAPRPDLAQLDELLDAAAQTATVRVERSGDPWSLGETGELTVYRVVQEALSNARRHAPGRPIDVGFSYTPTGFTLTVDNAPPRLVGDARPTLDEPGSTAGRGEFVGQGPPTRRGGHSGSAEPTTRSLPGYGLVGMRERSAIVGGTLDAERTTDGGWQVMLRIPRSG